MADRSATPSIKLSATTQIKNTLDDGQTATVTMGQSIISANLTSGVEASQANRAWERRDTEITGGNTEDLDLYDLAGIDIGAGAGKDGLGQDWVMEECVFIAIKQTAGSGRLEIMPSSPTGAITWMPSMTVANGGALRSGGVLMLYSDNVDAFDIQDGVSHVLRLGANSADCTYDISIVGRHDDEASSSSSSSSTSSSSTSSSTSTVSSSSSSSSTSTSQSSSSPSSQSSSSASSLSSSSST